MSRRQQRLATLLLLAIVVTLLSGVAPARAAKATMTFTGALNVAGVLSSLAVSPRSVTVPAGGEVEFVNGTSVALTVTVGSKVATLEPGGTRTMLFSGAEQPETFVASASPVSLPVVGALTASTGQVSVLAIPARPMMSAQPPASPPAQPQASPPGEGWNASAAPQWSSEPRRDDESPEPDTTGSPSSSPSPSAGGVVGPHGSPSPVPTRSASSVGTSRGGSGPSADAPDEQARSGREAGRAETAGAPPVLPPFPGFSSAHDQLGLIVLLSTVVLAGLGTMAFRTVLAYRPLVEVGAHSQAARKARALRRQRG